jgi:hypothetical protein
MVRRRCRFIVVIDAGQDAKFTFEDLGNAVRKIYIDLGIRISFESIDILKNRPSAKFSSRAVRDAAALVSIRAVEAAARAAKAAAQKGGTAAQMNEGGAQAGETAEPGEIPYYALGTIHYMDADGKDADGKMYGDGKLLYVKPAYHGTETSPGIRSYAMAHPEFPHETTVDQWFTESQFESYRSLGLEIGKSVLSDSDVNETLKSFLDPPGG